MHGHLRAGGRHMFLAAEVRGNAGLTVIMRALNLGSFMLLPLLMSKPWIWSLHQPSIISTVSAGYSSQAGGSGSSWPMFTHGCCQTSSKVPLLVGLSVSILPSKSVISLNSYLGICCCPLSTRCHSSQKSYPLKGSDPVTSVYWMLPRLHTSSSGPV